MVTQSAENFSDNISLTTAQYVGYLQIWVRCLPGALMQLFIWFLKVLFCVIQPSSCDYLELY